MKKHSKRIIALLLTLVMAMAIVGCNGKDTLTTDGDGVGVKNTAGYAKDEYNLVFIPKLVHEWYEEVKLGIDKAVAELAQKGVKVNYTWDAPADAIVTDQIAKIESAAAKKPDGISIAIIDASATTTVINELVASGINVSTFDCDAVDSNRLYYCGHSKNYDDGFEMAEVLAKELNYKGDVAILAGTLSAINHQERVAGFKDGIAKHPDMKIVAEQADEDSIETALSVTEGYLAAYPNLKGLIGVNAASPIGAARAIKDAGKAGEILIVGMVEDQEAMKYVKDGTILCTLRQAVPTYGYNSVYNMLLIADGKTPDPVFDEIPAHFVTLKNVDDFLD
ncbi:MAG TPA: substrate-binding domain-containing protein [Clostridia bacterium]|nr:substrate-binding domain-containing protein [Clostridia bacterium]